MGAEIIEIVPDGEQHLHTRGRGCVCGPIVEPGESVSVAHRSLIPGDTSTAARWENWHSSEGLHE